MDTLTPEERKLSDEASKTLGYPVILYQDGNWLCDPLSGRKRMGFGDTPEEAIKDCEENNK
jgi:hypothetical protein